MNKQNKSLKSWMKESNIDVLLCQTRANVYYISGFDTDPHERLVGVFLFQEAEPLLVCPGMEVNQVKDVFTEGEIVGYSDTEDPWQKIKEAFLARGVSPQRIAVEQNLPWHRVKVLEGLYPEAELIDGDDALLGQRVIKTQAEIKNLRAAARLADYGVEVGISALKEGVTEMEVLAKIEYELKKEGVREMSFSTMVLFGEKAGDPHGNPGSRQLKKGDAVLFDLGVVKDGYCSDITRTVFFGEVREEDQIVYETVLAAQEASLAECKPGNPISGLDKAARNLIADRGYGDYFPHRIGHGLGIEVHEFPSLNDQNEAPLQTGMTLTIEPGIYIPNKLGVRIEDDVLITEDGYETLTIFPKDITVVPEKLR
ncbi:M24 family metallopeptidase [Evansella clarkii]|uniref:M24 family metallopeptidase n=1 Tax=Evansella clarkii TaxID=79879 RepID=UPI000B43A8BA|nr:Xaa-Pro peptidase family protein [Evansella clarkii]